MRKRILSILLTLCMVLCLVPTAVLAADEVSAKVNGIAVPAAGGSITGEGISGSVVFDASAKTLTLENATISVTTEEKAIEIRSGIDTLILKGKTRSNGQTKVIRRRAFMQSPPQAVPFSSRETAVRTA